MTTDQTQRELTQALPRSNVRTWGVIEDTYLVHCASCRRCGDIIRSRDDLSPVVLFKEVHERCTGRDVKF